MMFKILGNVVYRTQQILRNSFGYENDKIERFDELTICEIHYDCNEKYYEQN